MRPVEPGETFEVEYGNGRKIQAVGLSFRQERELASLEDKARAAEKSEEVFALFETGLRKCLPHYSDDQFEKLLETLNLDLLQELIRGINRGQKLTEEDEKKSELPH